MCGKFLEKESQPLGISKRFRAQVHSWVPESGQSKPLGRAKLGRREDPVYIKHSVSSECKIRVSWVEVEVVGEEEG